MKPVYESIASDKVIVGDIVAVCAAKVTGVATHYTGTGKVYTLDGVGGVMFEDDESIKAAFRELPPERNPDVLERALELAERNSVVEDAFGRSCQGPLAKDYIKQAICEMESEGQQ